MLPLPFDLQHIEIESYNIASPPNKNMEFSLKDLPKLGTSTKQLTNMLALLTCFHHFFHPFEACRKANPTTSGGGCPSPGAARSNASRGGAAE